MEALQDEGNGSLAESSLKPVEPLPMETHSGILTLRDYQIEAVFGIYRHLHQRRSTLAVLATGLGKTVIAAEVAALWPPENGRVLFLAHRKELIEQGAASIGLHIDDACGIEMGSQSESRNQDGWAGLGKVLVGSVQTLCRANRLKPYRPEDFGLVITDEAHHATATTYRRIYGHFQQNENCRFLGITATPDRADEEKLGQIFETVAYKKDILDGINDGWLVPIRQKYIQVQELDFSNCRTTAGDLNERDLERAMAGANADEIGDESHELTADELEARQRQEKMLHAVADPTIREANGRPGIVFCVTVDHAEKLAEVMRRYGVTAETVTQGTSPEMRTDHIAAFKRGSLQFLVGVGVFTEGFDAPNAAVIAVARPTKSRALYTQMVGRGTRPDPTAVNGIDDAEARKNAIASSSKPFATVLDFVGNSGKHKLISTLDILGDAYPADLRAEAERLMRTEAETDPFEALKQAEERREKMRQLRAAEEKRKREEAQRRYEELRKRAEEEERLRHLRAESRYQSSDVDPFGNRAEYQHKTDEFRGGATDKQVDFLVALGVARETAMRYGKRQAGAVIDRLTAKVGGEFRITRGKNAGKSLAEAGEGFAWWVQNVMDPSPMRDKYLANIEMWRLEKSGVSVTTSDEEAPF